MMKFEVSYCVVSRTLHAPPFKFGQSFFLKCDVYFMIFFKSSTHIDQLFLIFFKVKMKTLYTASSKINHEIRIIKVQKYRENQGGAKCILWKVSYPGNGV